jgi:hypothetical protein
MNDSKAVTANAQVEPDFKRLLNSLKNEASTSLELSTRINSLSNRFKEMPEEKPEKADALEKEPVSVVDSLWVEICKLRRANSVLEKTVEHLHSMLG